MLTPSPQEDVPAKKQQGERERSGCTSPPRPAASFRSVNDITSNAMPSVMLVAAIGVFSSLDVLRNKPLGTLRAE